MSTKPFYRRFTSNAIAGMQPLTLEERGAYNTVIDLIYDKDRPIQDDRTLLSYLNCDIRVWRRIRARLIELEKIIILPDGRITNSRSTLEIAERQGRSDLARTSGVSSGEVRRKSKGKPNKNNENRELSISRDIDAPTEQSISPGKAVRSPDRRTAMPGGLERALKRAMGEQSFDSYLGRATYDPDTNALTPATRTAWDKLRRECAAELKAAGVTLIEPPRLTAV